MLGAIYRFLGWLVLPAAILIALILFAPFATAFSIWSLLNLEAALYLVFWVVAAIFVVKGIRAVRTLYGLATKKQRARAVGLAAVEAAVAQRTVVR